MPTPNRVLIDASLFSPHRQPEPTVSGASTISTSSPSNSFPRPISVPPRILPNMSRRNRYRPATIITALPTIPEAISTNSSTNSSTNNSSTSNRSSTPTRPPSPLNLTSPITRSFQFAPDTLPPTSTYTYRDCGRSRMIVSPPPPPGRSTISSKPRKPLHLRRALASLLTLPRRLIHRKRDKLARLEHAAHRIRVDHIVAKQRRAIRQADGLPLGPADELVKGWRVLPRDVIAESINYAPTKGTGNGAVMARHRRGEFLENCDWDLESGMRLVKNPELETRKEDGYSPGVWVAGVVILPLLVVGAVVFWGVRWAVRMVKRGWREVNGLGKEAMIMGKYYGLKKALCVMFLLLLGVGLCVAAVLV